MNYYLLMNEIFAFLSESAFYCKQVRVLTIRCAVADTWTGRRCTCESLIYWQAVSLPVSYTLAGGQRASSL